MSDLFPSSTGPGKNKGWFSQPENVVTAIIVTLLSLAGIYFFSELKMIFWNAVSAFWGLIALLGSVLFVGWLVMADAPRTILWNLYKNAIRNTYRLIIQSDPIGIMKNFIERQQKQKEKFDFHITEVAAQVEKMGRAIDKNAKDAKTDLERAEQLRKMGNQRESQLQAAAAEGLLGSNKNMLPRYQLMQKIMAFLTRASEAADYTIRRTQEEVRQKQQEFDLMVASGKATASAMSIFSETSEDRKLFDMAMEEVENVVSTRTAEMDRLMKMSEGVLSNMDADQAVNLDHGIALLDRYMNGEDVTFELNPRQQQTIQEAIIIPTPVLGTKSQARVSNLPSNTTQNKTEWD